MTGALSTDFFTLEEPIDGLHIELTPRQLEENLWEYHVCIRSDENREFPPITLQCKLPAKDVIGVWHPNALYAKRLRADWEAPSLSSCATVGAPVISVFGQEDQNRLCIACADSIHPIQLGIPVREEDNFLYGSLNFFTEALSKRTSYETSIRVDTRAIPYSKALQAVSNWWEGQQDSRVHVPASAAEPVYSTWYSYHQNLDDKVLLKECQLAQKMGYKVIIIDDGWQTKDSNRGYDFTGDWQAERLTQLKKLSTEIHALGMKVMIWYSVPFCGIHSKAYKQFKGKFLTENHRWAPVFDPRYPEVRAYLVDLYVRALQDWDLDGFKLDFIDDFKVYPDTPKGKGKGRDYASVYAATDKLLAEVYQKLSAVKPDVLIEFRQEFIGPRMQQYANMFRAFDCPQDHITNRLRTTDTRLLSPRVRVHSDMITWHYEEKVEIAARQFLSIMFSVPQISVRLHEISPEHLSMLGFYTRFWLSRREVLLDGVFTPQRPLANYSILKAQKNEQVVIGVYEAHVVQSPIHFSRLDLLNGSQESYIYLKLDEYMGKMNCEVLDCMGNLYNKRQVEFAEGILELEVPPSGIAIIHPAN